MTEALMVFVVDHGALALFLILAVNCVGVPFPTSLIMLAVGSLIEQGEMALWPVLAAGIGGAVLGDQTGYVIGRWGGARITGAIALRGEGAGAIARARALTEKWGGLGVFFTRWLLSPLGPYVNLASGAMRYPWERFLFWDFLGEALWVTAYVGLGIAFSRSVQNIADVLGSLTWFLVFGAATLFLGWRLFAHFRKSRVAAG